MGRNEGIDDLDVCCKAFRIAIVSAVRCICCKTMRRRHVDKFMLLDSPTSSNAYGLRHAFIHSGKLTEDRSAVLPGVVLIGGRMAECQDTHARKRSDSRRTALLRI